MQLILFHIGGGLSLRIFLRSKWLLDLPDLEIFLSIFGLFQREKIIFCQNAYFCLKMIFRPCYFYFFHTLRVGWVGFEKCGKFHFFLNLPLFTFKTFNSNVKKNIFYGLLKCFKKHF